ncbi:hypothetical protein GCM10022243_18250 [Saccharothrix violaceirubra]
MLMAVLLGLTGLVVATPYAAAGPCSWPGCAYSVNETDLWTAVLRNWCWPGETGDSKGYFLGCAQSGVSQDLSFLSPNGGHTPPSQAWNVLRVDAGWCYKVHFERYWSSSFTRIYDQRGRADLYVMVGNEAKAHIQGQGYSSCP